MTSCKRHFEPYTGPLRVFLVIILLLAVSTPQTYVLSSQEQDDILVESTPQVQTLPPQDAEQALPEFVPGRVIIKLKDPVGAQGLGTASLDAAAQIIARGEIRSMTELHPEPATYPELARQAGLEGVYVLELQEGVDVFQAAESLSADPNVEYAEPDYILYTAVIPNDVSFTQEWGLNNTGQLITYGTVSSAGKPDADIDLPEAWEITRGSRDIIIAVIDTGADLTHPDLSTKLVPGYNFISPGSPPQDDGGHGTHVSGTAAAATNNGIGVAGVCWECRIMPLKALGTSSGSTATVASAIKYAVDHGAHVINMSLGGPVGTTTLQDAVKYAYAANVPIVAAMMNEGTNVPYYPAAYPETIAIGSTNKLDVHSDFSCYGSHIDLSAPGEEILSTYWLAPNQHVYAYMGGTSMATPHVAGVIGLIRSVAPLMGIEEIRTILRNTADDLGTSGWDVYYGAGRLNAFRALGVASNAITSLSISGTNAIRLGQTAFYTTRVGPSTVQVPLTYTWEASNQTLRTATTNNLSNQATYTWSSTGWKTVKVTVKNSVNSHIATKKVLVYRPVFLPALNNQE